MYFKSFFDEQLAHRSYLIGCQGTGEAIVIDPARHYTPYLETAKKEGLKITAAAETHIHADYLSGARELAHLYGIKLYMSDEGDKDWKYEFLGDYEHELLKDGSVFSIGKVQFEVMHTPGHTPESISFLLTDKGGGADEPMGIFTGDFLFVGDVGRPDLLEKAAGSAGTSEKGGKELFASLKKVAQLPDFLQVWPAHGAGSSCGKSLGAVPVSTIGYEKTVNWAFQVQDEAAFVKELLSSQPEPPTYFGQMKKWNKSGPALLNSEETPKVSLPIDEAAILVDTRPAAEFALGHVQGSLNLPYNGSFTNWAGWLLKYDQDIVLIAEEQKLPDIKRSLQSIGLDRITGFITPEELSGDHESYEMVSADQVKKYAADDNFYVIDVRAESEWDSGHIPGAHHHFLGNLENETGSLPKDKTLVAHCQSGARSAIATSMLQKKGFKDVLNFQGGFSAWEKEGMPVKK
ncbi:rhodanese-like domain-containing protein [Fictibacillus aquaticus]|uniref:MBL fold metallo-hydrolase n=1 Tax=Fictibacillus aquaticus TaxID=2021314 RepID=A0A235F636_9BACL|nr:MBL fold metallo-hydrolase [Fictibacillus aquaticus]OYD56702.1 MBL fold metallo-hydrolase [Fictibacillus aquaticus]